jgi:hypothetical protein
MSVLPDDKHGLGYLPDGGVERGVNSLLIGFAILLGFALATIGLMAVVDSTENAVSDRLPTANETSEETPTDGPLISP